MEENVSRTPRLYSATVRAVTLVNDAKTVPITARQTRARREECVRTLVHLLNALARHGELACAARQIWMSVYLHRA